MKLVEFEAVSDAGPLNLPDVQAFDFSMVFCDVGAVSISMPQNGRNVGYLLDEINANRDVDVLVRVDGSYVDKLRCNLDSLQGQDVDNAEDGVVWKFSGRTIGYRFDEAVVIPQTGATIDMQVVDFNAGQIMGLCLAQAQARGTLPEFSWGFDNTVDSNGVPWTKQISLQISPGTTYLTILQALENLHLAEFVVDGTVLRLYDWGTLGADRTTQSPPVIFHGGRDLSDSPRNIDLRKAATDVYVAGKDGVYVSASDADAVAQRGRRIERFASQGSVSDEGTLTVLAQQELDDNVNGKVEVSHGLVFEAEGSVEPLADFDVGDWVWSDVGRGLERYRLRQWVVSMDNSGNLVGSVVLNDLIAEREAELAKTINGIVGGTTILGTSTATDIPSNVIDGIAPAAPGGLTAVSNAYIDTSKQLSAQITALWSPVILNSDGTPITDLEAYVVQWQYTADSTWRVIGSTQDTTLSWSPVQPNLPYRIRVAARDRSGNYSSWTVSDVLVTGSDATPPPTTSTPAAENYIGVVRIYWNGLDSSGIAMPSDFAYTEVHVSTDPSFTPSASTLLDRLEAAGAAILSIDPPTYTYGTPIYVRFVAVDKTGNKSDGSTTSMVIPSQVVNGDLEDGVISTAKIANLAVNDAKIGSVAAGKITAGTISADITVSSRIKTADTGARVEMNSTGIRAYNSAGVNTVAINSADGSMTAIGTFRTASTGKRIELNASAAQPELRLYGSTVARYAYVQTADDGNGGSNLVMASSRFLSDPDTSDGRHGQVELKPTSAQIYFGSETGADAARTRLFLDNDQILAIAGTAVAARFYNNGLLVYNEMRAGTYQGGSGNGVSLKIESGNTLRFNWTGTQLEFWVDATIIGAI